MSKKSKKKNNVVYEDYSNANYMRIKGIPQFLQGNTYRKKVHFGYYEPTRNSFLITKLFFDNIEFVPARLGKEVLFKMPIPTDFDTEKLIFIGQILSCKEITPCFELTAFKGNTKVHNCYMTLNVINFVITEECISILVNI